MLRFACFSTLFAVTVAMAFAGGTDVRTVARPKLAVDGGATKVKPYTLARVKAEGVPQGAGIVWRVYPSAGVSRATTTRDTLEFVAPPGVYSVEILVIKLGKDGAVEIDESTLQIEFERCCEDKVPPTTPQPKPKSKANPAAAIGRIQFGNAGCSATVVGPRRADGRWDVLTAAHCVTAVGQRGKLYTQDGQTLGITVAAIHEEPDVCWLVTDDRVDTLEFAEIAEKNPDVGVKIWHKGYGVDKPGNREDGEVAAGQDSGGQLRFNLSVSSGDSGGGIFRADTGELISCVCCTTEKGKKASVWGGSTDVILRTRPRGASEDIWTPTPIPERVRGSRILWGFVPNSKES